MNRWYYKVDGADVGPFSLDEMRDLIAEGGVTPGTIAWTRGMADWLPAGETELAPLFRTEMAAEPEAEEPPPVEGVEPINVEPSPPGVLERLYPGAFGDANDMISPPLPPDFREDPGGAAAEPGWMAGKPWREGPPADDPAWQRVLNPDPLFGEAEETEEAVAESVDEDKTEPVEPADTVEIDELPEEQYDQFTAFREHQGRWLSLQVALLVFVAVFLVFALRSGSELMLASAFVAAVVSLPVHFCHLGICWSVVPSERRSGEPLMQLPLLLVPGVNIVAALIVLNNMEKDLIAEYRRDSSDPKVLEFDLGAALYGVVYMIVNGMFLWGSIMKVEESFVLVQACTTGAFLIGSVFFALRARRAALEIRLRQIMRKEAR